MQGVSEADSIFATARHSPEQEERQKVLRRGTLTEGDAILEVRVLRPYRLDHKGHKDASPKPMLVSTIRLA